MNCEYCENIKNESACGHEWMVKPQWISVKDRLPDHDGQVLAYMEVDGMQGITTVNYYKDEDHWEIENCFYDNCVDIPTHWIPLPDKPSKE